MGRIAALFAPLQGAVAGKNREDGFGASHPWHHELAVGEAAEWLDVEYHGEYALWFDDRTTITTSMTCCVCWQSPRAGIREAV